MKPIAIIEAQRPGLDSVILWDDGQQVIAYAYEHGHVTKTRPLTGPSLDDAILEVRDNFQINDAQLTKIHQWPTQHTQPQRILQMPTRWQ